VALRHTAGVIPAIDHQQCLAAATQGVFQQAGQLQQYTEQHSTTSQSVVMYCCLKFSLHAGLLHQPIACMKKGIAGGCQGSVALRLTLLFL
jgi:hypothetical protein